MHPSYISFAFARQAAPCLQSQTGRSRTGDRAVWTGQKNTLGLASLRPEVCLVWDCLILFQSGQEFLCIGVVVVKDFPPGLEILARLRRLDTCQTRFERLYRTRLISEWLRRGLSILPPHRGENTIYRKCIYLPRARPFEVLERYSHPHWVV